MNIRDLSTLERAAAWLEDLISACRPRGPLAGKDPALMRDVTRKAKALRTSVKKFREVLDDPHHQPTKEEPTVAKDPLSLRLYFSPWFYELARLVSYGGIREADLRERIKPLVEKYGDKMALALHELTQTDERTHVVSLRPEARRCCGQLLGPAPEPRLRALLGRPRETRQPSAACRAAGAEEAVTTDQEERGGLGHPGPACVQGRF